MCKLGRVHTQATTIFLTHAHQWHVGWDYGKINETRHGTLLKTKAWTSRFPLESVNSWQDRSRWKDRAIFKLFANFCHRAGDTRSPSWGPSEWRPGSHYQLCSNRDQCLGWQGAAGANNAGGHGESKAFAEALEGKVLESNERPSQISYDFVSSENQDAKAIQSWRCVPSQASLVPVPVCTVQKEVAQLEKQEMPVISQIWMMVFVRVSVSCMLLHDSEDPHCPCLNMVWTSSGARSVESTVEALCPGLRYPRPRSCVWLLI